jgi:pumilio family protein 6
MATKAPAYVNKRKVASGDKDKFDGKSKKPRLERTSNEKSEKNEKNEKSEKPAALGMVFLRNMTMT